MTAERPPTPEAIQRIAAIGVQGFLDLRPKLASRIVLGESALERAVSCSGLFFEKGGAVHFIHFVVLDVRYARRMLSEQETRTFRNVYVGLDSLGRWWNAPSFEFREEEWWDEAPPHLLTSQKDSEKRTALAFTHPYPVQRVSDKAITLGRQMTTTFLKEDIYNFKPGWW